MSGSFPPPFSSNKRKASELNFEESINKQQKIFEEMDASGTSSKVIHARNLPHDCTEHDLATLACPFGRVVNVLLLKSKNQGFIQMDDEQSAAALVQYYQTVRANIRGRPIYFQFSTRGEITAPPQQEYPENSILLVTILNVLYPITIEVLHKVFSKYGNIWKIIIFNKTPGTLQSLVQYSDLQSAANAKEELDGQNIYAGCCTLRVQYSQLQNLNVKYNNDKSRDFTNPSLPVGSSGPQVGGAAYGAGALPGAPGAYGAPHPPHYGAAGAPAAGSDPYGLSWGGVAPVSAGWGAAPGAYPGAAPGPYGAGAYPGHAAAGPSPAAGPCVLIVSGLDQATITPETLFTLFGVYGDVVRVKILYNKKDTALLQFATPQQAHTAMTYLDNLPFRGNVLKVNFSKYPSISMPRAGSEGPGVSGLTKDFTGSPLHRYKIVGSKNFQHITSPSSVLHLSNLPVDASEDLIKQHFSQCGTVTGFQFFSKDKRMALLEMASIEEAVEALIAFHDFKMLDQNIRVSFSKSTIHQHSATSGGSSSGGSSSSSVAGNGEGSSNGPL